jgi:hypothetical protein
MTPVIILGAITIVPIILLMVLRVNAALVFLSLCLGDVLVQFASKDVNMLTSVFSAHSPGTVPDNNTIKLILLFLPVVLTIIFMIKTVKGHGKLLLNLLPAAGVGVLSALLAVPLLPLSTKLGIINSPIWTQGQQFQGYIVGLSATVCLLTVWMQRPKHSHDDKHAKGKH